MDTIRSALLRQLEQTIERLNGLGGAVVFEDNHDWGMGHARSVADISMVFHVSCYLRQALESQLPLSADACRIRVTRAGPSWFTGL